MDWRLPCRVVQQHARENTNPSCTQLRSPKVPGDVDLSDASGRRQQFCRSASGTLQGRRGPCIATLISPANGSFVVPNFYRRRCPARRYHPSDPCPLPWRRDESTGGHATVELTDLRTGTLSWQVRYYASSEQDSSFSSETASETTADAAGYLQCLVVTTVRECSEAGAPDAQLLLGNVRVVIPDH